jgi:hypothetical protein
VLQFAWQPTPPSKRLEIQQEKAKAAQNPALAGDTPQGGN